MRFPPNHLPRYSVAASQPALALVSSPNASLSLVEDGHTKYHIDCPACAIVKDTFVTPLSADMTFRQAVEAFQTSRAAPEEAKRRSARYVSERTWRGDRDKFSRLAIFFGDIPLRQIHIGHLRSYQQARLRGDGFTRKVSKDRIVVSIACPTTINKELAHLERLLRLAGLWTPELDRFYKPFQDRERDIPKSLSFDEQERFLEIAALKPEWSVVYWYSLLALDLTWSTDEMRTIRQGECNLNYNVIGVNRDFGKNKYRRRETEICSADAVWALQQLVRRSIKLVGEGSDKFVFPIRRHKGKYDGDVPMSSTGLRKHFEEIREAAGVPWFCLNGWRHTAATRLAEAGVPIAIIMARMGHCNPAMTAHYTHISKQAERLAINGAGKQKPVKSIDARALHASVAGY
jgi:integrase